MLYKHKYMLLGHLSKIHAKEHRIELLTNAHPILQQLYKAGHKVGILNARKFLRCLNQWSLRL